MKSKHLLLAVAFLGVSAQVSALEVTPATTQAEAEALANAFAGPGITISNITYTGAVGASGTFTGGEAAGIGIESGVLLTSGSASNVDGITNTSDSITTDNGLPGTAYLDALAGVGTNDATVLEFDFTLDAGGDAFFSYVFGSDEYNEFVDQEVNDVFGFFLDGTEVADNVALIPGSTDPVSIDTVNLDDNSAFYNNNDIDDGGTFPFEYDGFTTPLNIALLGLTEGAHHLTLAIADGGDWVWDSGVFLQADSFSTAPPPTSEVPVPAAVWLFGTALIGFIGISRRRKVA
jgi:hypothetical protein